MTQPITILIPQRDTINRARCRDHSGGLLCGLDKGHANDYHIAFGIDGKVPLMLWITREADERRLTTPPTYQPPTIYPRDGDDPSDIYQWIR